MRTGRRRPAGSRPDALIASAYDALLGHGDLGVIASAGNCGLSATGDQSSTSTLRAKRSNLNDQAFCANWAHRANNRNPAHSAPASATSEPPGRRDSAVPRPSTPFGKRAPHGQSGQRSGSSGGCCGGSRRPHARGSDAAAGRGSGPVPGFGLPRAGTWRLAVERVPYAGFGQFPRSRYLPRNVGQHRRASSGGNGTSDSRCACCHRGDGPLCVRSDPDLLIDPILTFLLQDFLVV
jgi:hypothetical protein